MTTMLPYTRQPAGADDSIGFDPEPGPLPDAMIQNPIIHEILYILAARFTNFGRRADNFLESNTFICYDRSNLNVRVAPDCYLALGVDALAIRQRRLYLPWEVGKPPDFALEVASESTGRQDVVGKRRIYAQIGIPEYWRFDPTGGQFHGQPLAGDRLVNGVYQPIALTTEPDGVLKGYSPILGLSLCWHDQSGCTFTTLQPGLTSETWDRSRTLTRRPKLPMRMPKPGYGSLRSSCVACKRRVSRAGDHILFED